MDEIFYEIYDALPRGGPGDIYSTGQALKTMSDLPNSPEILDVGCGKGIQTIELAKQTGGHIIALDNHQHFLDILEVEAREARVDEHITCHCGDMLDMSFEAESFDLIWSEGAIYIVGFEQGLKAWKKFLPVGGYVAVTEVSWIKGNPPDDLQKFWQREYPAISEIDTNVGIIEAAGYDLIDQFILPESAWWDDYYTPLEARIRSLENKYNNNREAQGVFEAFQVEIDTYRKYADYYGYVFYVMQRRAESP